MFRELMRKDRQLSYDACIRLLQTETRGVLSVQGDNGYPYGMPMNHWYDEEDGKLYFHCGRSGHRLDALRQNDKVSFCVHDAGVRAEGEWAFKVQSVIVFGRMRVLDDPEKMTRIVTKLSHKFIQDDAYIQNEIRLYGHETLLLELTPEHICGKLVTES